MTDQIPDAEVSVSLEVNGRTIRARTEARTHLIDFLRNQASVLGSHASCEHGVCGACTVRLNGKIVRGCLVLAAQADGSRVETIEGLGADQLISDLQKAFIKRNALQCGFCTPGMLLTAAEFVGSQPSVNRAEIRKAISGNYCRCTGYHSIVEAIADVVASRT